MFDRLAREARAIGARLASDRDATERQAGELRGIIARLHALASDLEKAVAPPVPPAREGRSGEPNS
jgi:hypothetical protein